MQPCRISSFLINCSQRTSASPIVHQFCFSTPFRWPGTENHCMPLLLNRPICMAGAALPPPMKGLLLHFGTPSLSLLELGSEKATSLAGCLRLSSLSTFSQLFRGIILCLKFQRYSPELICRDLLVADLSSRKTHPGRSD